MTTDLLWPRLAVVLAASLAACRASPRSPLIAVEAGASSGELAASFPVTRVDALGRTVVVAHEPRRIVSLLPSHTETLFALGVGERVVGVDDYSDAPSDAARLPHLGGLYDTQIERALSLAPDLVLLSDSSNAVAPFADAGIAAWAGSARGFEDAFQVIADIGKMLGRGGRAATLIADMKKEIAEVEASARAEPPVSVYYELDATPYAIGPTSFVGVMLAKVGGVNIVPAELGPFPKINPELVVAASPSVIIGPRLEQVAGRPGWTQIAAVRQRRVYHLSDQEAHLIVRPGPRIPQAMRVLARILRPST